MDTVSVVVVKEEIQRDVESNGNNGSEGFKQDFSQKVQETTDVEKSSTQPDSMASSSKRKEQNNDQLESTKAEMGEVREENERLKIYLGKLMKDYQTLQAQFNHIVQQEAAKSKKLLIQDSTADETELVSLSLGSFSGPSSTAKTNNKDEKNKFSNSASNNSGKEAMIDNANREQKKVDAESLSLGLDYKYISEASNKSGATDQGGPTVSNPSAESSFEEQKEETSWPPSKGSRPVKRNSAEQQDEVSQVQNPVKKARVCVRARCDTPTMNDGCQWRKYGQKIAKGNPCPRAYYRCTVAPSCPVRKQVQRCADDMSILITTYEGTHNHPLPVSATAMASTTSAAASMLLSGSSTSSTARPTDVMAQAFNTFESSKWNSNSNNINNNNNKQFYLPNTSTYSSFQSSHPTITLDLTSSQTNDGSSLFLNKFSSPSSSSAPVPNGYHGTLYPSASLSFGGASADNSSANNVSWAGYGASTHQQPYHHLKNNNNNILGALGIGGRQISTQFLQNPSAKAYQNYMQHSNISANPSSGTSSTTTQLPDITIAAATKAITTDPTFQSALAAALTSIIGGGGGGQGNNSSNILQGEVLQNSKWLTSPGDHQQQAAHFSASSASAASKGNVTGCASTFLNKSTSAGSTTNSQPAIAGGLMFLSSNSVSFPTSKSASASPSDAREHTSS